MVVSSTLQFDCVKVCFASDVCVSGWWLAKVFTLSDVVEGSVPMTT